MSVHFKAGKSCIRINTQKSALENDMLQNSRTPIKKRTTSQLILRDGHDLDNKIKIGLGEFGPSPKLMLIGMGSFAELMIFGMGSFQSLCLLAANSSWHGFELASLMPFGMGKVNIANMTLYKLQGLEVPNVFRS